MLAVIVLFGCSVMTAGLLRLTGSMAMREHAETERLRAFYIAEAGLSEAYEGLRVGLRGQIGHSTDPARFGDGLLWVTAEPDGSDRVRLECTALVGSQSATLGLVARRVENSLGIFADEEMRIDAGALLDGFDSSTGAYLQQVVSPPSPSSGLDTTPGFIHDFGDDTQLFRLGDRVVAELDGTYYDVSSVRFVADDTSAQAPTIESWDDIAAFHAAGHLEIEHAGSSSSALDLLTGSEEEFEQTAATWPAGLPFPPPDLLASSDFADVDVDELLASDSHSEGGALLGSNGDIRLDGTDSDPVEVYGDLMPGVGHQTVGEESAHVSGTSSPRTSSVSLEDVVVPDTTLASPVVHSSTIPLVVSSGSDGFESLRIASDADVIIRGPGQFVIGELTLENGARLELDTSDGDVELFVTDRVTLAEGAEVLTSATPSDVSIQVAADDRLQDEAAVQLRATSQFYGTIYAPRAEVVVGSTFELHGGVVSRMLHLEPGASVHYDAYTDELPDLYSWRVEEVPAFITAAGPNPGRALGLDPSTAMELPASHDLGGIELTVRYVDDFGIEQEYTGSERDFDWSGVATVTSVSRSGADDYDLGDWAGVADPTPARDVPPPSDSATRTQPSDAPSDVSPVDPSAADSGVGTQSADPVDTAPADTAPADTAPADTAPADAGANEIRSHVDSLISADLPPGQLKQDLIDASPLTTAELEAVRALDLPPGILRQIEDAQ